MRVLVTGCAGFIGMHCAQALLARGNDVTGVDCLTPYYPVRLKELRLAQLEPSPRFRFERIDLADAGALDALFARDRPELVLHLAAQPGVRYSLENPGSYIHSNLTAFSTLLEACRHHRPRHLAYASSSSVYGGNTRLPWSESDNVDHPVSLYAATKKSNELMAHVYSHLFGLPSSGLRFFTVYGPWGRPDMSPMLFASAILEGRPIDVFNHGDMQRDFTYIDDVVAATLKILDAPPVPDAAYDAQQPDPARSWAPWRVVNVGNHQPVGLLDYIHMLEDALGAKATINLKPMQPGDVRATYAATERLADLAGSVPATTLPDGLKRFADWFRQYHRQP